MKFEKFIGVEAGTKKSVKNKFQTYQYSRNQRSREKKHFKDELPYSRLYA